MKMVLEISLSLQLIADLVISGGKTQSNPIFKPKL